MNNSFHLERKYAWIFVRVHNLFREANGLPREKLEENSKLWRTDRCKRTSIRAYFLRQMYAIAIVFTFIFKCFSQHARFWKSGNITRIFFSFGWGIFSHVMRLDQSRASENIWWIIGSNTDHKSQSLTLAPGCPEEARYPDGLHNED